MWCVCANKTKRFELMDIVLLPVSEGHGCPLNVLTVLLISRPLYFQLLLSRGGGTGVDAACYNGVC